MTHNRELLLRAAAAGWARLPCLFSLVPVVFAAALSDAAPQLTRSAKCREWGKFLATIKKCHPPEGVIGADARSKRRTCPAHARRCHRS